MNKRMLIMKPIDNSAVVLEDIKQGDTLKYGDFEIVATENIEFPHKIATRDITKGEDILKYGEVIGYALKDISKGQWIHIHNMDDVRGREGRLS